MYNSTLSRSSSQNNGNKCTNKTTRKVTVCCVSVKKRLGTGRLIYQQDYCFIYSRVPNRLLQSRHRPKFWRNPESRRLFLISCNACILSIPNPEGYFRHPVSRVQFQSRTPRVIFDILPRVNSFNSESQWLFFTSCLACILSIPNPELQIMEIPDPEKPTGDLLINLL